MTLAEFSNTFDVLYNNITSNAAPGLTSYEKSVFLTKAQEELVKDYFNAKSNKNREGIGDSPKRESDFSTLIYTETPTSITTPAKGIIDPRDTTLYFTYPANTDILFFLNETLTVTTYRTVTNIDTGVQATVEDKVYPLQIVPLQYAEYRRLMMKPFKFPAKTQAWKLLASTETQDETTHIDTVIANIIPAICPYPSSQSPTYRYTISYVKYPSPIILETSIDDNAKINGVLEATECRLSAHLHREILDRAVELAKVAYLAEAKDIISINQRNE